MGMNTNNLGLSNTSTKQLERMIGDAAILTYPLHVLVGILKMFVFVGLCILAVFISITVWLMNAHANRAEWTKNFATQQSTYRVSFVNKTTYPVVVKQGSRFLNTDAAELVWGCPTTSKDLKKRTMFADNWLEEKSDAFQSAYIAASCNMVSLTERLKEAKGDFSRLPNMPNAPVVLVSFLKSADYEQMVPADYQGNWYTGMCLIGAKCTDADFVPRNTSIFYDAVAPQMTANQDAAVKALYATATPEFWIARRPRQRHLRQGCGVCQLCGRRAGRSRQEAASSRIFGGRGVASSLSGLLNFYSVWKVSNNIRN
jgi:hypothetical protein